MKYILAHDLGTSGNKATLFSDEGKMITSEVFRYDCHYFNTNWPSRIPRISGRHLRHQPQPD
mgnify:FL=1